MDGWEPIEIEEMDYIIYRPILKKVKQIIFNYYVMFYTFS